MEFLNILMETHYPVINATYDPEYIDEYQPPHRATDDASGFDLRADIDLPQTLMVGESNLFPSGLSIELPRGLEAQVRPRSGLAYKHGITVLNGPGTIDADYRGDIGVILINHGQTDFTVRPGMRIGQLVIQPIYMGPLTYRDNLEQTERGDGGFGSTGTA